MAFRYLRDPLFLGCFFAYWTNSYLERLGLSVPIARCYLNDLICIPFWVPIIVWVHRRFGLRDHDQPPRGHEVVVPLLIWALIFEVILPSTQT